MKAAAAVVFVLALAAAACDDPVAPPSPTPVEATTTEQFAATLAINGSNVHPFVVSQVGRLRVTLTLPEGVSVALAVGTPLGAACQAASTVVAENSTTPQISGTATITGVYCISVTAPATLTESVAYSVSVSHS
jgi:hypothetical protein